MCAPVAFIGSRLTKVRRVAAVPCAAQEGRQRIPLAPHDQEDAGEFGLHYQQALVSRRILTVSYLRDKALCTA